ncbi:unnamed protein product [Paramecium sonneborni]|uniref:Uncharacterized protein n=1 Tax=Paramecium sonneborni TaxID=65129 RepID=A0A8S1RR53_9CILI|nr:unnamed protein product [Paramecium sonneborni]
MYLLNATLVGVYSQIPQCGQIFYFVQYISYIMFASEYNRIIYISHELKFFQKVVQVYMEQCSGNGGSLRKFVFVTRYQKYEKKLNYKRFIKCFKYFIRAKIKKMKELQNNLYIKNPIRLYLKIKLHLKIILHRDNKKKKQSSKIVIVQQLMVLLPKK